MKTTITEQKQRQSFNKYIIFFVGLVVFSESIVIADDPEVNVGHIVPSFLTCADLSFASSKELESLSEKATPTPKGFLTQPFDQQTCAMIATINSKVNVYKLSRQQSWSVLLAEVPCLLASGLYQIYKGKIVQTPRNTPENLQEQMDLIKKCNELAVETVLGKTRPTISVLTQYPWNPKINAWTKWGCSTIQAALAVSGGASLFVQCTLNNGETIRHAVTIEDANCSTSPPTVTIRDPHNPQQLVSLPIKSDGTFSGPNLSCEILGLYTIKP